MLDQFKKSATLYFCSFVLTAIVLDTSRASELRGLDSTITLGSNTYRSCYIILDNNTLVEAARNMEGHLLHISVASATWFGSNLALEWADGGKEIGKFSKSDNGAVSYKIISHTDRRQVGMEIQFQSVRVAGSLKDRVLAAARSFQSERNAPWASQVSYNAILRREAQQLSRLMAQARSEPSVPPSASDVELSTLQTFMDGLMQKIDTPAVTPASKPITSKNLKSGRTCARCLGSGEAICNDCGAITGRSGDHDCWICGGDGYSTCGLCGGTGKE